MNKLEFVLGWLRAVTQVNNYNYNKNNTIEFQEFAHNVKLGLGWLGAGAQGYMYSYTIIEFVNNFLK